MAKKVARKTISWMSIIIIIFLAIRLLSQIFVTFTSLNVLSTLVLIIILALLYAVSLFGVAKQESWGFITTIIASAIDLFFALAIGGANSIGAGIFDVIILVLAILELRK